MPYPEIYPPEDATYHPIATQRAMFVDAIDRQCATTILEHLAASTAKMRVAQIRVLGGAIDRVPVDATAYAHRGRRILVTVAALRDQSEDAVPNQAWVDGLWKALQNGEPGAYVNFLNNEGPSRVREAYPGKTWDRLTAIKAQYDPTNLFRLNQNIPPAARTP